jgi:hypothetical protein
MTAGLPGVGITGLFFIVSALAMPMVEAYRLVNGTSTPRSRRLAARQFLLALFVVASLIVTVAVISALLPQEATPATDLGAGSQPVAGIRLPIAAGLVAVVALVVVVVGAWAHAQVERRRTPGPDPNPVTTHAARRR